MNKLLLHALSDRAAHDHNLNSIQYLRTYMYVTHGHMDSSLDSYLQVTAEIHRHSVQIGRSKMTVPLCLAPSKLITASLALSSYDR